MKTDFCGSLFHEMRGALKVIHPALKASHPALKVIHPALKASHSALKVIHPALKVSRPTFKASHHATKQTPLSDFHMIQPTQNAKTHRPRALNAIRSR